MQRSMMRFLAMVLTLVAGTRVLHAQDIVPNGDFETWLSGEPVDWVTSALTFSGSIIQTSDAHSGSWAVQGSVVEIFPGFNGTPFLQSSNYPDFPVTQRWGSLKGFYKLTSVGEDALVVGVLMFRGGIPIGGGTFFDSTAATTYTELLVPIQYSDGSVPESAYVYIYLIPGGGGESAHLGSQFILDDLVFSPDSSFGGECPIAVSGDASGDGEVKTSDIIYLVNYVLKLGPEPLPCPASGDANGDGEVKSSDIIYLVNYVLKAGPAPEDICALIPGVWSCP